MDTTAICPNCGNTLFPTDQFCSRCGEKREQNQSIGIWKQVYIYLVSIFLPPFGLIWTWKYRHGSTQMKRVGYIAAILTITSLILTVWATFGYFQMVQSQLNSYSNLGI